MSLTAFPSSIVSTANLIISSSALVTTVATLFPLPLHPVLVTTLRFLHCLLLLSPAVPSIISLSTLIREPTATLATSAAAPLFDILDAAAAAFNATSGLSRHMLTPSREDNQISALIHVFVILFSLLSVFIIITHRRRVRRESSVIAFVAASIYILATLLTAFRPGELDLDTSLLKNKWLDAEYTDFDNVNETRLLQNFWLRENGSGKLVPASANIERFGLRFCQVFNQLPVQAGLVFDIDDTVTFGTTPPTTLATTVVSTTEEEQGDGDEGTTPQSDEDDRPQPQVRQTGTPSATQPSSTEVPIVTRSLLSQILVVYTIGKPLFTTFGKSLSLLSLPFLTLTPVFIAHTTRSRVLFPFTVGWIGVLLVLTIYATPETLRWIRAPFDSSDLMTFCGRRYRVFVTDNITRRIAIFDVVSFALVGVTAIVQGFRWFRREVEEDKEVKMLSYEDVYSGSGSLRW